MACYNADIQSPLLNKWMARSPTHSNPEPVSLTTARLLSLSLLLNRLTGLECSPRLFLTEADVQCGVAEPFCPALEVLGWGFQERSDMKACHPVLAHGRSSLQ